MRIKKWFFVNLVVFILSLILLITGSSILTKPFFYTSIPIGTFTTWFGIISLQLSVYLGLKLVVKESILFYKYLFSLLKTLIAFAVLWMPICYFLAGNFSFIFTKKETFQGGQVAMKLFWNFTYGISIAPIILLISNWISNIVNKLKK